MAERVEHGFKSIGLLGLRSVEYIKVFVQKPATYHLFIRLGQSNWVAWATVRASGGIHSHKKWL